MDCFRPGRLWLDNNGTHINAHGGGVLFHDGRYYWFGEHKTAGRAGNKAMVGVHCYSSEDLYDWYDEGIALPVSDDSASEIAVGCVLERPKVVHCAATGSFVMWFHLELKGHGYKEARSGVAQAETVTGPYRYLGSFRPNAGVWPLNVRDEDTSADPALVGTVFSGGENDQVRSANILARDVAGGQMARDMTLFADTDGTVYHAHASEENSTLHISRLTRDCLQPAGQFVRAFEKRWMEAPAFFRHGGKYWFLGSGCSGWAPNAARSGVADTMLGTWRELGNPCVGVNPRNGLGSEKTFGGQSTFVLPVHGRDDAFIAMFDLWRPENAIDGRYVWLPVRFVHDRFEIPWIDEWGLSWFD
ncbi:MAG: family 43 glycosylhydrolase [Chitinivibrionales bacterium]|nr:family 43 glycosylhydrolase [Chitinivibrionales bacterium]